MKKLLVLMLVLGIASLASATPVITGPSTIAPGATETYTVSGTSAEVPGGFSGVVWLDFAKNYPTATYYQLGPSGTAISPTTAMGDLGQGYNYGYVISFVAAQNPTPTIPVAAGAWFTFTLTANSDDEIGKTYSLDLGDSSWTNILDSVTVTVIPEPMTIALLGLGGLLLRRRK